MLSAIEIREPTGMELIELGDPVLYARSANGAIYGVPNDSAVQAYLEKCLKVDGGCAILALLPLADGIAIKEALLGFFHVAAAEG